MESEKSGKLLSRTGSCPRLSVDTASQVLVDLQPWVQRPRCTSTARRRAAVTATAWVQPGPTSTATAWVERWKKIAGFCGREETFTDLQAPQAKILRFPRPALPIAYATSDDRLDTATASRPRRIYCYGFTAERIYCYGFRLRWCYVYGLRTAVGPRVANAVLAVAEDRATLSGSAPRGRSAPMPRWWSLKNTTQRFRRY